MNRTRYFGFDLQHCPIGSIILFLPFIERTSPVTTSNKHCQEVLEYRQAKDVRIYRIDVFVANVSRGFEGIERVLIFCYELFGILDSGVICNFCFYEQARNWVF